MSSTFTGPVISTNGFTGAITGNVTGNVAGVLTGSVVGTTVTATTSATIGSGTAITKIVKGTCTVDLPSIADADVGEATVTITGAATNDIVVLIPPTAGLTAGLAVCGAVVSATDTVKVRAVNGSGGTIDEASGTWIYLLIRS